MSYIMKAVIKLIKYMFVTMLVGLMGISLSASADWGSYTTKDKMTDQKSVVAHSALKNDSIFYVRCAKESRELNTFIMMPKYSIFDNTNDRGNDVMFRIDNNPAYYIKASQSTNHKASFLSENGDMPKYYAQIPVLANRKYVGAIDMLTQMKNW